MQNSLTQEEIERRLRLVINRLGFVPRPYDTEFLSQVPSWNVLLGQIRQCFAGGLKEALGTVAPAGYFSFEKKILPSLEQRLAGATIAQRGKVLELSKPGTRKTISALSAIPLIETRYLPKEFPSYERLKTFITCPGYIIPIWIREIEKLFVEPNIVVVTRENRQRAIQNAARPDTGFVIVGYDMTFRDVVQQRDSTGEDAQRYLDQFMQTHTLSAAHAKIGELIGAERLSRMMQRNYSLPRILDFILEEEQKLETLKVFETLKKNVFLSSLPYYSIIDEFHNLVGPDTKRADAIGEIAKPGRWAALLSGTGIGNVPEGLAWAAYITDFAEHPDDFKRFIARGDTAQKVRTFLDATAVYPMRKLEDIDSSIKKPLPREISYELSAAEIDLFTALIEAQQFNGREKYLLFRYLSANPRKLLPINFSHLNGGDQPLQERVQQLFDEHPGLEEKITAAPRSRIEALRNLVTVLKSEGEKCIIACEYQRDITTELEVTLSEAGVRRIDQKVSAEVKEIRVSGWQRSLLASFAREEPSLFRGNEVFLSDLSAKAKKLLSIMPYEIYGMSEREIVLHEFTTDPDIAALATTRVLREGMEAKEAIHLINFEQTTVPCKNEQIIGRIVRSGQHRQTYIWNFHSPILRLVEEYLIGKRESKERLIELVHDDAPVSDEKMRAWLKQESEENAVENLLKKLRAHTILGAHFNKCEGAGSDAYCRELLGTNNALFIASLYNHNWETSYSGNISRLTRDLVKGVEKRKNTHLEHILDAGCGPLALARALSRPITSLDMNRYQIQYGIDACEDTRTPQGTHFLGDITDFTKVIPLFETTSAVFDSDTVYPKAISIPTESHDLVLSSLVIDLLDRKGRDQFLREAHRVLVPGGYFMLVIPSKRIETSCRAAFLDDLQRYGFAPDTYFTGTYQGCAHEEGQSNNARVEAYAIVAEKTSQTQSREMGALRLRQELKIVENGGSGEGGGRSSPKHDRIVRADYFVKLESGLNLIDVEPEKMNYDHSIREIALHGKPEEITQVIDGLRKIFGGNS